MDASFDPLPVGWPIDHAEPSPSEQLEDLNAIVDHALAHPLSTLPIMDLCGPGCRVTVVVAIAGRERDAANAVMMPALMRELEASGVRDEDIILLIPNALHHPSTIGDKRRSLGDAIVGRYAIVDHDPTNLAELDDLGAYQGVPLLVNYRAVEADLLIAVDVVEPHYYAGYSGGNKTVSIGCAGESTLNEVRTARFLDDVVIHPADTPDNLAMLVEQEIGRRAGLKFVLNTVIDVNGRITAISAGAPNAVHDALLSYARRSYEVGVPRSDYNIIIAGNGPSANRTLYHASRAAVAIGLTQDQILMKGGVIILPVHCDANRHIDRRERQFYEALSSANDMDTVLSQLSQRGIRSGEQRAYMLAQTMLARKYHVIAVSAECADLVHDCGLIPARNMLEAASLAETIVGRSPRVLMLPHAAHFIPITRWQFSPDTSLADDDEDIYIRSIISDN
ncbi:MAG: lactate racemase domain-containing protein [Chloroflexi bacterium]|nr:lactate racemase domain-containing protein [Chloroflexota bacterium]